MIDALITELAKGKNFATLTTIFPDGYPQTSVMWVDSDDEHVLINTEVHRTKYKNLTENTKVSVVIWDMSNPYRYVEVRGDVVATITGPEARSHIDTVSEKYTGKPYGNPITSERVILKISPTRVRANG